jgi:two-component system, OmpR family, sensor kinase
MASIRTKLTVAYTGALLGSMAAFSIALYAARRSTATQEAKQDLAVHADQALRVLRFAASAGESPTQIRDSLVGAQITPRIASILDGLPGYVILLDKDSRMLYASPAVRAARAREPTAAEAQRAARAREQDTTGTQRYCDSDYDRLICEAVALPAGLLAYPIDLTSGDVMLVALPELDPSTLVTRVVAGNEVDLSAGWAREFLLTVLAVAPFIIGVSAGVAYIIAGRAVEPVGRMINDVEAITDGRSLHRRLPVETTGDELARLAATLNAMIARLETSFSALRRFTADASHELKTPLAVLRADVERAMHSAPGANEQLVALEEALQETTRMADLVDSLLTLARADEGRFDLHREPFALEPLVHEVFETAVILGEDAGLTVSLSAVDDATILGDRVRLRQLFLNLVTNAIKYTSRGGTVEVTVKRKDGEVQFAVRDTGIGIAAADLPYIFERFWRADRARSRLSERGGFGLGLAISQWIAQAHGGSLTVQSRLHRGSTFTVSLPIAPPMLASAAATQAETTVESLASTDPVPPAHAVSD